MHTFSFGVSFLYYLFFVLIHMTHHVCEWLERSISRNFNVFSFAFCRWMSIASLFLSLFRLPWEDRGVQLMLFCFQLG